MTGTEMALAALLAAALVAVVVLVVRSRGAGAEGAAEASRLRSELLDEFSRNRGELSDALSKLRDEVSKRLAESAQATGKRLDGSSKLVDGRLEAVAKRMDEIGKTISAMGKSHERIRELAQDIAGLQQILQPPKARGGLGELLLENALREVLPAANFELQYGFDDGSRVDAVVRLEGRMVPIDSKFPLDSFRRLMEAGSDDARAAARRDFVKDVKVRIDETASYIRPEAGTFDFALMYVPAENVYYEAVLRSADDEKSIAAYARSKKVVPVSPNSLYSYLRVIALGLRGLKVEERAEEVLRELGRLARELGAFGEEFRLVGRHLKNASGKYDDADKRLEKLADRLGAIESSADDSDGEGRNGTGGQA